MNFPRARHANRFSGLRFLANQLRLLRLAAVCRRLDTRRQRLLKGGRRV